MIIEKSSVKLMNSFQKKVIFSEYEKLRYLEKYFYNENVSSDNTLILPLSKRVITI